MGDGSEQEYTAAARSQDDWEEITRLRKLLNEARLDTERLDIAQELLQNAAIGFGDGPKVRGLRLPEGLPAQVVTSPDIRVLLDAVNAKRDGTDKP